MELRDDKPAGPDQWRYYKGKRDKRAGLVYRGHILDEALHSSTKDIELRKASFISILWYRIYEHPSLRLGDFFNSLNTDQSITAWAAITSTILSIIAIVISLYALYKS